MNYALMIYTIVAMAGNSADPATARDWRYLTTFPSQERCVEAAKIMGISSERYRCVVAR
jgi:hypothetical protein